MFSQVMKSSYNFVFQKYTRFFLYISIFKKNKVHLGWFSSFRSKQTWFWNSTLASCSLLRFWNQEQNLDYISTTQVDMSKVKLDVLKPWITQKITEILKLEDDVVIDYVNNQLEEKVSNIFLLNLLNCKYKNVINAVSFL